MNARRYLGLDLGGTNIKLAVVEDDGDEPRRIAFSHVPTFAERGPAVVVERLGDLGRAAIERHGPVERAGIGIPGLFDRSSGRVVLFPNLPGPWPGHPLRDPVAAALGVPVTVVNDARAFTLAEGVMGAGRGCETVVGMTLGTGIGGGILIGGKLHLGRWGIAGEIGHQTVAPGGPRCGCGGRGCLEAVAQAGHLARLAGRPAAEDVYRGLAEDDARCRDAVLTVAEHLGTGIANIVTILGPDRIVIGGGIVGAGDLVLEPIRAAVRRRVTLVPPDEISIVAAALGQPAGAIGAALAAAEGSG